MLYDGIFRRANVTTLRSQKRRIPMPLAFPRIVSSELAVLLLASVIVPPASVCQTYTTTFDGAENPLTEGGKWSNGGLDWTNIRKGHGIAYSTEIGTGIGKFKFNDSYAVLSGYPPDQEAWGEAYVAKANAACIQELEILLRFTSSPHHTTGYECFARCVDDRSSYVEIVRWDGPLGKFTYLARMHGPEYGLKNGDILKASIIGNVITVYINGVKKARAVDDTFKSGNPGIGEFLACDNGRGVGTNADFGFRRLTAKAIERSSVGSRPAWPLKVSANKRYLVDQNNVPFLIAGDSPQALVSNLNEEQAEHYFANRQAHGFNAVGWMNVVSAPPCYPASHEDASTFDRLRPFSAFISGGADYAHYDLTKPNATYFAATRSDDPACRETWHCGLSGSHGNDQLAADPPQQRHGRLCRLWEISRPPIQEFSQHRLAPRQ